MSSFTVRYLEASEYQMWDRFVEDSPQGTIYSSILWLSLSGMPFKVLGCFDGNNELVGGISFTESRRAGFKRITSPLLTPFQGILLKEDPHAKQPRTISRRIDIIASIMRTIEADYDLISFCNHVSLDDIRPFLWNGYSITVRYTYILDCSTPEILWSNIHKKTKRDIRNALKHGIAVVIGDGKYDIHDFDQLHQLTFEKHGLQCPIPTDYLVELYNGLKGANRCQLYFAHNGDGELVSSEMVAWDNRRAYGIVAATHPILVQNSRGASHLTHWIAFEDMSKRFAEIDFVGANTPGITDFKRRFGGELRHYFGVSKATSLPAKLLKLGANTMRSLRTLTGSWV